jgi:hypothetical protein
MSNEHEWIKIEITPIHVLANGMNPPIVLVDPDDALEAEENTQYGCGRCEVSLDEDTVETLCPGEDLGEIGDVLREDTSFRGEHPDYFHFDELPNFGEDI